MTLLGLTLMVPLSSCETPLVESVSSESSVSSQESSNSSSLDSSSSSAHSSSSAESFLSFPSSLVTDVPHGAPTLGQLKFLVDESQRGYTVGAISEDITGDVVIPSTYKGYPVTAIRSSGFEWCSKITSIYIPKGVKRIEADAITTCFNLQWIFISETVETIGDNAIGPHDNLTITVSDASPYFCTYDGALYTKDLTEIIRAPLEITSFNSREVTSLYLPSTLEVIRSHAFTSCQLGTIEIPQGVKSIGYEAFGNSHAKSLYISDTVETIENEAFYMCEYLKTIRFGNHLKTIGDGAFFFCLSLTNINIPDSVTSIGTEAFYGCHKVTSFSLGNGLTTIGEHAFDGLDGISGSISIPKNVATIGRSAFGRAENVTAFEVDARNTHLSSFDGVIYNKEKTELIMCPEGKAGSVSIPDGVTSIAEYAFHDCSLLTSIPLPDSLLSVDTAAFMGCSSLSEMELPVGVTEIPIFAFDGCTSLTSFTVGKYIEKIGTWAFFGCSSLASLDLGYGVTEISEQAFTGCSSLTTVEIPETITKIGRYTFKKCTSLTSVTFNVGLTSFGERLFEDCSSLTDVTFLGTIDEWNAIEKGDYWYRNSGVTMVKCTNGNVLLF